MGSAITSALLLLAIGDFTPVPEKGETGRYVWEVDLLPGTFLVHCEKLPSLSPGRHDMHYFTVAFHTPDNVQFAIVTGMQPPRAPGFKDLLSAAPAAVRVDEVRKLHGGNDQQQRVIASHADGFSFTLQQKTRVFFAAEIVSQETERFEAKALGLLKDWSSWRHSYAPHPLSPGGREKGGRKLPFLVQWDADREIYRLAVDCRGSSGFRDWLITVDYQE